MMDIVLAIVFGTLFGFVLQRVGAADPEKIIGMLRLTDLHLMKAIFAAIGILSALLFLGVMVGVVDGGNLSIKSTYWGVIVGGVLLGAGWAVGGFCPGTGVAAAGSGRVDAWFFIVGGLLGAGLYTFMYESVVNTWLMMTLFGGKATLVETGKSTAMLTMESSQLVAIVIGAVMVALALMLPVKMHRL